MTVLYSSSLTVALTSPMHEAHTHLLQSTLKLHSSLAGNI
jgi:hypothetical protein